MGTTALLSSELSPVEAASSHVEGHLRLLQAHGPRRRALRPRFALPRTLSRTHILLASCYAAAARAVHPAAVAGRVAALCVIGAASASRQLQRPNEEKKAKEGKDTEPLRLDYAAAIVLLLMYSHRSRSYDNEKPNMKVPPSLLPPSPSFPSAHLGRVWPLSTVTWTILPLCVKRLIVCSRRTCALATRLTWARPLRCG